MAEKAGEAAIVVGVTELVTGVESRIYALRGMRVMLAPDLAQLSDVETRALMQAVRRNVDRFPSDFMFELSRDEAEISRSQSVTLNEAAVVSSRSQTVSLTPKKRPIGFV